MVMDLCVKGTKFLQLHWVIFVFKASSLKRKNMNINQKVFQTKNLVLVGASITECWLIMLTGVTV